MKPSYPKNLIDTALIAKSELTPDAASKLVSDFFNELADPKRRLLMQMLYEKLHMSRTDAAKVLGMSYTTARDLELDTLERLREYLLERGAAL